MFRRKMARVARALGEPSLVKELERYDGTEAKRHIANQRAAGISVTEIPFKVAVSSDLESLALSANGWCSPWSGVRRFFADRYGLSPAQFDRAYPSGKREWLALARKARELTVFDRQALKWDRLLDE